jgi:hypothetical protein
MRSLIFVACLAAGVLAQRQQPVACDSNAGARNATIMDACVQNIKAQSFSEDKIKALGKCIESSADGFSAAQAGTIIALFDFSSDRVTAVQMMNLYLLGFTCKEVSTFLNTYTFSDAKLDALSVLVNASAILDVQNNQTIIDAFTFSSDQDKARAMLAQLSPRSCTYGKVTAKHVIFVVDTSGSMAATFSIGGVGYTRLSYVSQQLDTVLRYQLDTSQSLNVLRFSSSVQAWQPGLVPVNPDNVDSAVNFIAQWTPGGGTNAYDALVTAFNDPDMEALYFLSDGTPSVGITDPSAIIAKVQALSAARSPPVPVHTTALIEGTFSGDDKAASVAFMHGLAAATGGVARVVGTVN